MSIKQATLEFDENNIIALCGLNDSGKTAIETALSILLYDNFSRDQVRFIREGEDYFSVSMHFKDGVTITKVKRIDGASIWTAIQNKNVLYTNQLKTSIQAVNGVPEPIKNYFGVIEDECTGSLLNVRRNRDKLFLIDTTGGDNYKLFNTILKSEVLAKASIEMNADKNKLHNDTVAKANAYNALAVQCNSIEVAPVAEVEKLHSLTYALSQINMQYLTLSNIKDISDKIHSMEIPPEIVLVTEDRLRDIDRICRLHNECTSDIPPEVKTCDLNRLQEIQRIMSLQEESQAVTVPEATTIDLSRLEMISKLCEAKANLDKQNKELTTLDMQLQMELAELRQLSADYDVKVCPNCGTVVV